MDRVPSWVFVLAAIVFAALAIWSATDENWAGLIIGVVLAVLALGVVMRGRATR